MPATITAIRYHLPEQVLDNDALAKTSADETVDSLWRLSGIRERHIAKADETPSDLATQAAEALFTDYPQSRPLINALIFCTEGLDHKAPATACILHHRLGLMPSCLALDIPGGCTGFINSLLVANSLIHSNSAISHVLLLTAETVSKVLHPKDTHLRMLFGDGACATLISRSDTPRIGKFITGTDGSRINTLWVERSGFRAPIDHEWLELNKDAPHGMSLGKLSMQGHALLHFALTHVPRLIEDALIENQLERNDISLYVFHQASKIILESLRRKCRIPEHLFFTYLERTGNTVSSTIPIALYHALESQHLASGSKIMLVGFGIGLSWGATVIEVP